ncbi:universal stress protein [Saccharopolyspora hirsuta]|uniref:Universal stress protein n=1 Tax=Saccharopolyspora hirsuta TaxID=1837 RepID=A0A5M7C9K5_SACHI|nr:universal stress protein [Saccharopolyspora hirsuta]KAA5838070.1 universal stress protein [Saccharopolyspora hirsuta]
MPAVVVGVDGSDSSAQAAEWAAAEADRRHVPLHVVLANDDPARAEHAEDAVGRTAAKCRTDHPGLEVTAEVLTGRPVEVLVDRSSAADLLVVGARGLGGFTRALLGGVSLGVASRASCPVVVVRRGAPTDAGPVVVGVDGSPCARSALEFAFSAAAQLGADLVVLQAWHEENLLYTPLSPNFRDEVDDTVRRILSRETADLRQAHPDVVVHEVAQRGHPVAALTDAARDARLLVVGHRGGGGFDGLFLGSVAAGVLNHAQCPVAVIRNAQLTRHGEGTGPG